MENISMGILTWDEYERWNHGLPHTMCAYSTLDASRLCLFLVYGSLMVLGVCGNAWVVFVLARILHSSRRHAGLSVSVQLYILALCCCDLIVLPFIVFLLLDLAYGCWPVPSRLACQLYLCSESINKFCAPFILTAMSGYCYYAVCRSKTTNVATGMTGEIQVTICAIVASLGMVCVLIAPVYMYGDVNFLVVLNGSDIRMAVPKCSLHPPENILTIFTVYTFLLGYLTPAVSFTFCYAAILHCVYRRRRALAHGDVSANFWRVAKMCMGLVLFYLACWTAYWVMSLYHYFTPQNDAGMRTEAAVVASYFLHLLPYIHTLGLPILYTLMNRNVKEAYSQVKADRKKRRRDKQLLSNSLQNSALLSLSKCRLDTHEMHTDSCTMYRTSVCVNTQCEKMV